MDQYISEITQRRLSESTWKNYNSALSHFVAWLFWFYPSCVCEGLLTSLSQIIFSDSDTEERKLKVYAQNVLSVLNGSPDVVVVCFSQLNRQVNNQFPFMRYIAMVSQHSNSIQAVERLRSAHASLYTRFNEPMDVLLAKRISEFCKGYKKRFVEDHPGQNVGKERLKIQEYKTISMAMLKELSSEFTFARTVLVLSWNLMCRVNNTTTIRLSLMDWDNDALVIRFGRTKTDTEGKHADYARHVYANPLYPEICPILALAIFWASYELSDDYLFPGANQKERYIRSFNHFLRTNHQDLLGKGVNTENVGTHSIRKGAVTYVQCGSTEAPPSAAVRLRAGWSLGSVQERYIFEERAADQYIGRLAAGLPHSCAELALLPPHFLCNVNEYVEETFMNIPPELLTVGSFCLASLIYHAKWLAENLPPQHVIFKKRVFSKTVLNDLSSKLRYGLPTKKSLQATGIPPSVNIMNVLKGQMASMENIEDTIKENGNAVVARIMAHLDDRGLGGTLSIGQIKQAVVEVMEKYNPQQAQSQPPTQQEQCPLQAHGMQVYLWGGAFHKLPQDFDFNGTLASAWQDYCCGRDGIPPLHSIEPVDVPPKSKKSTVSTPT